MNLRDFYLAVKKDLPEDITLSVRPGEESGAWDFCAVTECNSQTYHLTSEINESDFNSDEAGLAKDCFVWGFDRIRKDGLKIAQ